MAKAKDDAPKLTVEEAIAAARAKRDETTEPSPAVKEFLDAGVPPASPVAPLEPPQEDLESELDASFNALFAETEPVDTDVKLDPDGTLTFNLSGVPESATAAKDGPLAFSDEPNLPENFVPAADVAFDFEPELPVDWDRLSEATRLEIAAGRTALTKHGNPAR